MNASLHVAKIIQSQKPRIVVIDGGTSSGKTYFQKKLSKELQKKSVRHVFLDVDDYLISRQARKKLGKDYYDLKKWFKLELLAEHLQQIVKGVKVIKKPGYDHRNGKEKPARNFKIPHNAVIIVNGIFSADAKIRKFADLVILIDASPKTRLARELVRNKKERNIHDEAALIKRFKEVFEPTFQKHLKATKKFADIIVDNNDYK